MPDWPGSNFLERSSGVGELTDKGVNFVDCNESAAGFFCEFFQPCWLEADRMKFLLVGLTGPAGGSGERFGGVAFGERRRGRHFPGPFEIGGDFCFEGACVSIGRYTGEFKFASIRGSDLEFDVGVFTDFEVCTADDCCEPNSTALVRECS